MELAQDCVSYDLFPPQPFPWNSKPFASVGSISVTFQFKLCQSLSAPWTEPDTLMPPSWSNASLASAHLACEAGGVAGIPPVRRVCSSSSQCTTGGLAGNADPQGWVCRPGGGWEQGGECSSVPMDRGQHWAKGLSARWTQRQAHLDVLPLRASGQQGSHLSASWSAVEISLSAVLFSGDPWLCSGALRYPS